SLDGVLRASMAFQILGFSREQGS
ncbi:MAG: hypothetical protein JWR90_4213, partial [Marmoricola sp.]|nr:hypothetical protein [Marmoricola sp.]